MDSFDFGDLDFSERVNDLFPLTDGDRKVLVSGCLGHFQPFNRRRDYRAHVNLRSLVDFIEGDPIVLIDDDTHEEFHEFSKGSISFFTFHEFFCNLCWGYLHFCDKLFDLTKHIVTLYAEVVRCKGPEPGRSAV
ncbi:hypothetical protein RJ640_000019 [Escallonia rubra]|uniref:Uncharacterized protein n=1 Tax=Escallonia rubra TaxID=112253 RepID=A0AA88QK60_9ASTE|nr:hypothetical protein RJ640_000019 [Escallonia rubra]